MRGRHRCARVGVESRGHLRMQTLQYCLSHHLDGFGCCGRGGWQAPMRTGGGRVPRTPVHASFLPPLLPVGDEGDKRMVGSLKHLCMQTLQLLMVGCCWKGGSKARGMRRCARVGVGSHGHLQGSDRFLVTVGWVLLGRTSGTDAHRG